MEYKVVETFPVRDGVVKVGEKVWWHCEEGPKHLRVDGDIRNIMNYPQYYSINKPVFVQHPEVDWLVIYEHEEAYKHMQKGHKVVRIKHERKRPEFTFEDGVFLGQDCGPYAGYVILTMEHSDVFTVQQQIGAVHEYLKATTCQSDYSFKPLRKKLKLYIKWLQSHGSVVQSGQ